MDKKKVLSEAIYRSLKESINVNDYIMNPVDIDEKKRRHKYDSETERSEKDGEENKDNSHREKVLNYLKSAQQKHSEYAYHLWPHMDKDDARSLFSKKFRGHDAEGNHYSFDEMEINTLYSMIDDMLEKTEW